MSDAGTKAPSKSYLQKKQAIDLQTKTLGADFYRITARSRRKDMAINLGRGKGKDGEERFFPPRKSKE